MSVGEKLKELRGDKRREVVAAGIGVSVSALAMYECDKRIPRDETKRKLAAYYGVSVQDLFFAPVSHEM